MAALRELSISERASGVQSLLKLLLLGDAKITAQLLPYLDELTSEQSFVPVEPGTEAGAAAMLLALPPGKSRDHLLSRLAIGWMRSDWKAATNWARTQDSPLKERLFYSMASQAFYTAGSPAWAIEWLTTSATPAQRQEFGKFYVASLAKTDASAALAWAQNNMAGRALSDAVASVVAAQAAADPAGARSFVEQMPPGGVKERAAFAVAELQADEAAVRWLLTQVNKNNHDWYRTAMKWADRDPAACRQFLTTEPVDSFPLYMIEKAINVFSHKDARGTVEWAQATGRERYLNYSLEYYCDQDPVAAAEWIKAHPDAVLSDAAIWIAAERNFRRNPAETATWARQLHEGPRRAAAVSAVLDTISKAGNMSETEKVSLRGILGAD